MSNANAPAANRVPLVWNIPNILTMTRIALVPVFVVLLLQDFSVATRLWAFGVFVLAAITDRYDGHLARKNNMVTNFGKMADPIADKLLTGSALILLSYLAFIPWWVTIVILAREIGITVLRFFMVRRSVMASSKGGKLKTVLQIIGICLLLVPWVGLFGETVGNPLVIAGQVVIYLALAQTVITGGDYVLQAIRISRENKST